MFSDLRANVSFANETFWRAVGMGEHVEQQHSILLSTRDSLELVAERGAANHSIECTARKADYWSTAEANTRYEPVINQNATVRDRIEKVSTQISYINMAAGKSQELMPEAFSFGESLFFVCLFHPIFRSARKFLSRLRTVRDPWKPDLKSPTNIHPNLYRYPFSRTLVCSTWHKYHIENVMYRIVVFKCLGLDSTRMRH